MNRDEDRDYEWERRTREVHGATHVLREKIPAGLERLPRRRAVWPGTG